MGLLDAFKQYWQDASPGGVLNPEIPKDTPVLGLLADPMGSIRSTLNKANAQADAHLNKLAAASRETAKTGKWTGPAQQAYQGEIGNWLLNTIGPLMFVGPKAKTWDAASATKAQEMAKSGVDPRTIWSETGTWKGPDGHWRQEIPDNAATGQFTHLPESGTNRIADKALVHPKIYDAYPELNNISQLGLRGGKGGKFETIGDTGMLTATAPTESGIASVGAHEVQHAIQNIEGFARGGNPEMFANAKKSAEDSYKLFLDTYRKNEAEWLARTQGMGTRNPNFESISDGVIKSNMDQSYRALKEAQANLNANYDPEGMYRSLAGEAEARATQARLGMDAAQRRATFPEDSYDVPINQLIVRGLLAP